MKKLLILFTTIMSLLFPLSSINAKPEINVESLIEEHGAIMLLIDPETGLILYANKSAVEYYGYSDILDISIHDINMLSSEEVKKEMDLAASEQRNYFVFKHKLANGDVRTVEVYSMPYEHNGQVYLFSIIYDVTEKNLLAESKAKTLRNINYIIGALVLIQLLAIWRLYVRNKENKVLQMKLHNLSRTDLLTGLYNRFNIQPFFDEISSNGLPYGIFVLDADGLKLINDAFGHRSGDEVLINVSNEMRNRTSDRSKIMRISGDEFLIIVPNMTEKEFDKVYDNICNIKVYTQGVPITVSVGGQLVHDGNVDYERIFRQIEDKMYKHKLSTKVVSGKIKVDHILNHLFEESELSKNHTLRVTQYVEVIARRLFDDDELIENLLLASQLHDIGRVAVNLDYLDSDLVFSAFEHDEIKKHCEKGFNILKNVKGYERIAESALYHHEYFDGNGYPLGLKGKTIPLYSRIIAVADAFDGMTGSRLHKEEMTLSEARSELIKCSGTQFDPEIVDIFVDCIDKELITLE